MDWSRRRLVGTAVATVTLAGCLGEDSADDGDVNPGDDEDGGGDGDDRDASALLEEHDLEDHTGEETVEITVDPDGDGFEPDAVEIDRETVLEWTWEGTSTEVYPIDVPPECVWDEDVDEESVEDREAGHQYDRLFWADGAYLYGTRDEDGEEFTGAFRVLEDEESDE
ncbi:hypothetical protein [Natronorubrum sp. FCH18a]|uniref:hypothetical protein n=1 Tax=Natronorubrum sp. FCH18a TaxID=3447018 RepID=UPI003F516B29